MKTFFIDFHAGNDAAADAEAQKLWSEMETRGYTLLEPGAPALVRFLDWKPAAAKNPKKSGTKDL